MNITAIVPTVAAVVSAMLASISLMPGNRTRRHLYFGLMNLGLFLWNASYGTGFSWAGWFDASTAQSAGTWVFAAGQIGVALATTYWYLFAIETVGGPKWRSGWRLALAHAPGALMILAVLTNPLHRAFLSRYDATIPGQFTYGPLATPLHVLLYVLATAATFLYVREALRRGSAYRRAGVLLAIGGGLPLAGNIIWMTRGLTGFSAPFNPTVILLTLASAMVAVAVLSSGLSDLMPVAEARAFQSMSDAAVVLSPQWRVVALNPAAASILPSAAVGEPFASVIEALGADPALPGIEEPGARPEIDLGGASYWIRLASPSSTPRDGSWAI